MTPYLPSHVRRSVVYLLASAVMALFIIFMFIPGKDAPENIAIKKQITDLSLRMESMQSLSRQRKHELQVLFTHFARIVQDPRRNLEQPQQKLQAENPIFSDALQKALNWSFSLSLPGIHHFLPHVLESPQSLEPAFKLDKRPRDHVSMVFGIPTVRRTHQSYLSVTLKSILENMSPSESADCLIVVFIAETDLEFVKQVSKEIEKQFSEQVENGLIEVISPPPNYYPDFSLLRQTLGDDLERVQWRSKQNLDYAFLMMYAQSRGVFYVQLEDDILTKKGFPTIMKEFALENTLKKKAWFVIDFCQLGFIGKLFKTISLPGLIQFFVMFYNDKPVDWLLEDYMSTKVCKLDQDGKKCRKEKESLRVQYKPSLFQHIGTHSSLKGKVQKLKDKQFGRISMFVPHANPPAKIETVIKHYKAYSINRAYLGETYYWGLVPQSGDSILFALDPPIPLTGFRFASGNAEHPSDRFIDTDVEVALANSSQMTQLPSHLSRTSDGFVVVGSFNDNGIAEGKLSKEWGPIAFVRISIHATSENWVILSEIHLKTELDSQV